MKKCSLPILVMVSIVFIALCACERLAEKPIPGGYYTASVTNANIIAAADFAIKAEETTMQTKNPSATLNLVKILSAQQQVVAGMNYRLLMQVKVNGTEKKVEAVVWWQEWNKQEPYKLTSWTWE